MTINKEQLRDLITDTLFEINMLSESAVNLLMGTAAQESHLGTYIRQIKGPALGIFQMEPATHNDIWHNYIDYKKGLERIIMDCALMSHPIDARALIYNLKYAIIMCRLHYRRAPEALPEYYDVAGLAKYWKKYYNTHLGAGTEEEFIKNYERFVG